MCDVTIFIKCFPFMIGNYFVFVEYVNTRKLIVSIPKALSW